jgi:hypothetical protein
VAIGVSMHRCPCGHWCVHVAIGVSVWPLVCPCIDVRAPVDYYIKFSGRRRFRHSSVNIDIQYCHSFDFLVALV